MCYLEKPLRFIHACNLWASCAVKESMANKVEAFLYLTVLNVGLATSI